MIKGGEPIKLMIGCEKNSIDKVNPLAHKQQLKLINAVGNICESSARRNKDSLSVLHIVRRADGKI